MNETRWTEGAGRSEVSERRRRSLYGRMQGRGRLGGRWQESPALKTFVTVRTGPAGAAL